MKKEIIFGIGTGRCGTTSLASILNSQFDSNFSHEAGGRMRLPWIFDQKRLDNYVNFINLKNNKFIGDVSFYLVNHITELVKIFPECKIIVLKRDKEQTVESFMKKTRGLQHWILNPKIHSPFDFCFPKFPNVEKKEDRIRFYYDLYYSIIDDIPYSNKIYLKTEHLNNEKRVIEVLKFCNFKNPVYIQKHLNNSF